MMRWSGLLVALAVLTVVPGAAHTAPLLAATSRQRTSIGIPSQPASIDPLAASSGAATTQALTQATQPPVSPAAAAAPQPPAGPPKLTAIPIESAIGPMPPAGAIALPVMYHSQQDPDWCDPADLQMWMQADYVPLPAGDDHAVQQQLWDFELSHNDGYTVQQWDASPYAVATTLNHFARRADIGSAPQPTLGAAGTQISRSLTVGHEPVIVMVGGGSHYVLITGVVLGPDGANAPPAQVTIYDPLKYGVGGSSPDPTHGEAASWDEFAATYTANTHHTGIWADQWILIAAGIPLEG